MKKREMPMRVLINGDKWDIKVIGSSKMDDIKDEKHGGEEIGGLCVTSERVIYVDEDSIDLEIITHELFHAYFSYCYLDATYEMKVRDVEEVAAELFSKKGAAIIKQGKSIYKGLMKGKR